MTVKSTVDSKGKGTIRIKEVQLPRSREGYALVQIQAVALNPSDWQKAFFLPVQGATLGIDFAGVIAEIREGGPSELQVGDRVFGMTMNCNAFEHEDGCFGEYAVVKQHLLARLPERLPFSIGCTLGTAVVTTSLALYRCLGLEFPSARSSLPRKDEFVLIYGGSTATGTIMIQFAKLSGYRVIATNRPHNDELVLASGAEKTFDYTQEQCAQDILRYTNGALANVVDCISQKSSASICSMAIGKARGKICFLLPLENMKILREDVKYEVIYAYSAFGEAFEIGLDRVLMESTKADVEIATATLALAELLLSSDRLKPHPIQKRQGGLNGIPKGLKDLQDGNVSGKKLVYELR